MTGPYPPAIETADIVWSNEGQPSSRRFGDIYYSADSGIEESRYVFLAQNNVRDRLLSSGKTHFCIAETGFGTGLNFLCAWDLWLKTQAQAASSLPSLDFISVERWPLTRCDLTRALAHWPELSTLSQQLIEQYPPAIEGCHRLVFEQGRVTLTLFFGDATSCFAESVFVADAWFLDGFAPAKNPHMWEARLIDEVRRHSRNGSTFSTFTCAGNVKRALQHCGFTVSKVPGFGRKRQMLAGSLCLPAQTSFSATTSSKRIAIIGAGLAGSITALTLRERGHQVLVFEQHAGVTYEGSGNKQGAVYLKPAIKHQASNEFWLHCYNFATRFYQRVSNQWGLGESERIWHRSGLIQLTCNEKETARLARQQAQSTYPEDILEYVTNAEALSALAGIPLSMSGLFFPGAGWVKPRHLCQRIANLAPDETLFNSRIASVSLNPTTSRWSLIDEGGHSHTDFDALVFANAYAIKDLKPFSALPLGQVRGQTSLLPGRKKAQSLKTVLCADSYLCPQDTDEYCFGATFDRDIDTAKFNPQDSIRNLQKLLSWLPEASELMDTSQITDANGHAAFRCSTPDHLPLVGAWHPHPGDPRALQHGLNRSSVEPNQYASMYLNIGHGSKGLTSIPLASTIIADMIDNRPLPISTRLLTLVAPQRPSCAPDRKPRQE